MDVHGDDMRFRAPHRFEGLRAIRNGSYHLNFRVRIEQVGDELRDHTRIFHHQDLDCFFSGRIHIKRCMISNRLL